MLLGPVLGVLGLAVLLVHSAALLQLSHLLCCQSKRPAATVYAKDTTVGNQSKGFGSMCTAERGSIVLVLTLQSPENIVCLQVTRFVAVPYAEAQHILSVKSLASSCVT